MILTALRRENVAAAATRQLMACFRLAADGLTLFLNLRSNKSPQKAAFLVTDVTSGEEDGQCRRGSGGAAAARSQVSGSPCASRISPTVVELNVT